MSTPKKRRSPARQQGFEAEHVQGDGRADNTADQQSAARQNRPPISEAEFEIFLILAMWHWYGIELTEAGVAELRRRWAQLLGMPEHNDDWGPAIDGAIEKVKQVHAALRGGNHGHC